MWLPNWKPMDNYNFRDKIQTSNLAFKAFYNLSLNFKANVELKS